MSTRSKACGGVIAALLSKATMFSKTQLPPVGPSSRPFLPCPTQLFGLRMCHASAPSAELAAPSVDAAQTRDGRADGAQQPLPTQPSGVRARLRSRQESASRQQRQQQQQQIKTDLRKVTRMKDRRQCMTPASVCAALYSASAVLCVTGARHRSEV